METIVLKNLYGILAVSSFLISLSFLLFPNSLKRLSKFLNKWFSTRLFLRQLELVRDVEDKIYKRNKIIGVISLLCMLALMYRYIRL